MLDLSPSPALAPVPGLGLAPGRHGALDGPAGVSVTEMIPQAVVSVAAREGGEAAISEALRQRFGVALPDVSKVTTAGTTQIVWSGPQRWLIVSDDLTETGMRALIGDHGSITDQTDSRVMLMVTGSRVRGALAKGMPIDLHPSVFSPGCVAQTLVEHVGMMLWQLDAAPSYMLAFARSYAGSVWHWLEISSAEFGLEHHPIRRLRSVG